MQRTPTETRVILLNSSHTQTQRKKDRRKVFYDTFLFLLFMSVMGAAFVFSYLNNYLFLDRLLAGGFIIGALTLFKVLNTKI